MEKRRTIVVTIVAALLLSFSSELLVVGSYELSLGSDTSISIICILSGTILLVGDIFLILSIYLPRRRRRLAIRDVALQAMTERRKRSDEDQYDNSH